MKINLPTIKNVMPSLRGLNLWTLKQKIKDHTIQRASTIQLLYKIDIYNLTPKERAYLLTIETPEQQKIFIKTHGILRKTTGAMKAHSFTLQFSQLYIEGTMCHTRDVAPTNYSYSNNVIKDQNGTLFCLQNSLYTRNFSDYLGGGGVLGVQAGTSLTTYGILVGTGTSAPTNADYKLQTIIANGSSSGQLLYQATSVGAAAIVGANVDTVICRIVVNGSGGSITLKEVGLATQTGYGYGYNFLIAHDSVDQAIANTEVAVISYVIRTTV